MLSKQLAQHGQQVNWWELDDLDVAAVKQPLVLLNINELFKAYGGDLENITEEAQVDLIMRIEKLRDLFQGEVEDDEN